MRIIRAIFERLKSQTPRRTHLVFRVLGIRLHEDDDD
jgi:hypothetical protein